MSKARISLGKHGEDLAANHLTKKGFTILERNYRQKIGEIDIIARKDKVLVFIEVKTRKSTIFGQPFEAVTPRKQAQLSRVALDYMTRNKVLNHPARFDVVSILIAGDGTATIEHLRNCFETATRSY